MRHSKENEITENVTERLTESINQSIVLVEVSSYTLPSVVSSNVVGASPVVVGAAGVVIVLSITCKTHAEVPISSTRDT